MFVFYSVNIFLSIYLFPFLFEKFNKWLFSCDLPRTFLAYLFYILSRKHTMKVFLLFLYECYYFHANIYVYLPDYLTVPFLHETDFVLIRSYITFYNLSLWHIRKSCEFRTQRSIIDANLVTNTLTTLNFSMCIIIVTYYIKFLKLTINATD